MCTVISHCVKYSEKGFCFLFFGFFLKKDFRIGIMSEESELRATILDRLIREDSEKVITGA